MSLEPATNRRRQKLMGLPRDHNAYVWIAILAAAVFVGRSLHALRQFSHTIDEPYHIASAMVLWESHRPVMGVQHPPLARWVMGAGLAWAGLKLPEAHDEQMLVEYAAFDLGKELLFSQQAPYWRILIITRTVVLIFPLLLMLFTWKLARWLGGGRAGMLAVTYLSVDPTLLGHAFWIGTDVAGAAGFVAAVYFTFRWIARPTVRRAAAAGIALGLGVACKYTVLLLVPTAILIIALRWLNRRTSPRKKIGAEQILVHASCCVLVLWMIFGFDVAPLGAHQVVFQDQPTWMGLPDFIKTAPLPMPAFWMGLLLLIQRNSEGHPTYLLGMISYTGWWYYFPVAVLVKSSMGFLLGLLGGMGSWLIHPRRRFVVLLAPILVYFLLSCLSGYQLGIRHLLPIIPLCCVLMVCLLRRWAIGLILLAAVETAWVHPDYLAFFNAAAGGPANGDRYLIDSNLDWGQDVARLAEWLKSDQAPDWPYSISVFAGYRPQFSEFGLHPTVLGGEPHRLFAISKNVKHRLVNASVRPDGQVLPGPDFSWVDRFPLVKRIGYSIDVYDLQDLKDTPNHAMKPKLYMETFGCQMNVLDSELVLGQLRAHGYEQVDERDHADIILYNTCSVREHAEQKVWSRLGELRERKQTESNLVIGVIGCMAERDGTNIFQRFPQVDILCGPGELDKLPGMVHNAVVTKGVGVQGSGLSEQNDTDLSIQDPEPRPLNPQRQVALMGNTSRRSSTLSAAEDNLELLDLSRSISPNDDLSQAYVRITRGCNKFCTYCVVPYTRGPEVHRPPANIVDEVRKLVDAGVKEVTLLGQTINHYHYKHGDGRETSFAELLYQIHEATPDLPRLRFVTSFPRDFTDEALQAMRDCRRICRYLHVPAQSGSDRILKAMNRGYGAGQYRDFIDRARQFMPDVSIASDFIVGFPTETDEDFAQSVELLKHCRFKNSFIFKYSPRPGTTAIDRFDDDVPESVKRRRNNELLAVQQQVSEAENRRMVGQRLEVFVEGESKLVSRQKRSAYPASNVELGWEVRDAENGKPETTTQLVGRTRGDQVVCFDGDLSLKGEILEVRITQARNLTLFGELVSTHADV